jgi:hypothetical protein
VGARLSSSGNSSIKIATGKIATGKIATGKIATGKIATGAPFGMKDRNSKPFLCQAKTGAKAGAQIFSFFTFQDDQQTPDTVNITFNCGSKTLIFEMRIWKPYATEGVDNGIAVYGSEVMV